MFQISTDMKNVIKAFKLLCVLAASIMIGYWLYKFHKNDDITLIEYKSVLDLDDVILPELSLCLRDPVLSENLNKIGLDKEYYLEYLRGEYDFDPLYHDIDYHNVTLNIFDHFVHASIHFKAKKNQTDGFCANIQDCHYLNFKINYNGTMKEGFFKCFGVEIKKDFSKDIDYYLLVLDNKLRHIIGEASSTVLSFNHPNQFIRNFYGNQPFRWSNKTKRGIDLIEVTSIEMLKRRNKKKDRCLEESMHYDEILERRHTKNVGCRAPYQTSQIEFPLCKTRNKMKQSLFDGQALGEEYLNPCREMPNIIYNYGLDKPEENFGDNIVLYVSYPDKWKIITQSQAVDVHTLIGNIGGYIGLFLGKNYFGKLLLFLKTSFH